MCPSQTIQIITFVALSPPTVLCLHFNCQARSTLVFFVLSDLHSLSFVAFLRRVRSAVQHQNVFFSILQHSEEPETFLPVLLGGGGRGSHRLGRVLLVGCGGLGGAGLWQALRRVAHLPRAYHLPFLQTKVMLYTRKRGRQKML